MTIKELIIDTLKEHPAFRERSRKDRGFVILLKGKYPTLKNTDSDLLLTVIQESASMDRAWRQALQEHKELRGSDYEEKVVLEQEKVLSLGYEPGSYRDSKLLAEKVQE